ncbi:MAG: hypothetical protein R2724_25000 [Bryobacterales bacterium]
MPCCAHWLPGLLFGLDALFTAERTDAAIGPNDKIKVTKLETFAQELLVFVKISTDAGITGWGEMLKDDAKACARPALSKLGII